MTLVARHAAHSDIGLHRKSNEDAYVVAPPLFAVCDGMGGAIGGEIASRLAADTLAERVAAGEPLPAAAAAANTAVWERADGDRSLSGMGTTLTAVLLEGDTGHFAHIGDSRAYLLRDGELEQLSDDHSLVGEMMREGRLTAEEAAVHPHRSILSRALGTEPEARIDKFAVEFRPGDTLLLCSDGLSGPAAPDAIREALALDDPEAAVTALLAAARVGGAPDNVTAVVLRFAEPGAGDEAEDADGAAAETTAAEATAAEATAGDEEPASSAVDEPGDENGESADEAVDAPASGGEPTGAVEERAGGRDETASASAAEAARASRRRLGCVVVVLLLLLALSVGAAVVLTTVYYVGVDDGALTVYSGLPASIGPLKLHAVYRRSTKPYSALDAAGRRLVDAHTLRSRGGALALAEALGMWP